MAYLTHPQAVAHLTADGMDRESAEATLVTSLMVHPQSARTAVHLVTGYKAGTNFGTVGGITTEDLFTVGRW